jgi:hypothetical protein
MFYSKRISTINIVWKPFVSTPYHRLENFGVKGKFVWACWDPFEECLKSRLPCIIWLEHLKTNASLFFASTIFRLRSVWIRLNNVLKILCQCKYSFGKRFISFQTRTIWRCSLNLFRPYRRWTFFRVLCHGRRFYQLWSVVLLLFFQIIKPLRKFNEPHNITNKPHPNHYTPLSEVNFHLSTCLFMAVVLHLPRKTMCIQEIRELVPALWLIHQEWYSNL